MIPFAELTSPFFRNYKNFNEAGSRVEDCVHYCWAPNLNEPLWDALYLAINGTFCLENQPRPMNSLDTDKDFLSKRRDIQTGEERDPVFVFIEDVMNSLNFSAIVEA